GSGHRLGKGQDRQNRRGSAGEAPCERISTRSVDARRRNRDAPSRGGRTNATRLPTDPPQEPDPVGSACQPDPALQGCFVLKAWESLAGGTAARRGPAT